MSGTAAAGRSSRAPRPMSLLSDDRLAQRATQGDRRAFEAIYRRYHQDLYRFCLAMAGNPQDAQEALQNTMVKVLRALPGEEREIKLKPWLYRIARNETVETLRRRREGVELEPDATAAGAEIAQTVEDRERLRVLFVDLEQLPDRQRAALVMRELAGLDFAQIGEAFGSSAGVARQTLYEARLSLRQMEEGREMRCEAVMQALSDADGRVARRRGLRAHLRDCPSCRAFGESIAKRRGELAAISPLPVALSAGLLHGLLGGQASTVGAAASAATAGAGASGAGLTGTLGAGAGKAIATSALVKSVATVAAVAVVGGAVADRSGVVDLPVVGGGGVTAKESAGPGNAPASNGSAGEAAGTDGNQNGAAAKGKKKAQSAGAKGTANPENGAATDPQPANGHKSQGASAAASAPGKSRTGKGKSQAAHERSRQPKPSHGQEVAATHKPPHAGPSPGSGGKAPTEPKSPSPAKPPKAETPPPPPPEPTPDAGSAASKGAGKGVLEP